MTGGKSEVGGLLGKGEVAVRGCGLSNERRGERKQQAESMDNTHLGVFSMSLAATPQNRMQTLVGQRFAYLLAAY